MYKCLERILLVRRPPPRGSSRAAKGPSRAVKEPSRAAEGRPVLRSDVTSHKKRRYQVDNRSLIGCLQGYYRPDLMALEISLVAPVGAAVAPGRPPDLVAPVGAAVAPGRPSDLVAPVGAAVACGRPPDWGLLWELCTISQPMLGFVTPSALCALHESHASARLSKTGWTDGWC
eukprot:358237-Chlamydomonas_euryale.AAC.8